MHPIITLYFKKLKKKTPGNPIFRNFQVLMTTAPIGKVSFADQIDVTFSDKEYFKNLVILEDLI